MTRKEFNLARERRKAGLTQAQLAEVTGFHVRSVQRHEAEGTTKKVENYYKIIFENISK